MEYAMCCGGPLLPRGGRRRAKAFAGEAVAEIAPGVVCARAPRARDPRAVVPYGAAERRFTCSPDDEAPPRCSAAGVASAEVSPPVTLGGLLDAAVAASGDRPALLVERPVPAVVAKVVPPPLPLDAWATWTFAEYSRDARRAASAFVALGLARFESVGIWGFNAPEWHLSALGAALAGGKYSGLYPTDTPEVAAFKEFCLQSAAAEMQLVAMAAGRLLVLLACAAARATAEPCRGLALEAPGCLGACPGLCAALGGLSEAGGERAAVCSEAYRCASAERSCDEVLSEVSRSLQPGLPAPGEVLERLCSAETIEEPRSDNATSDDVELCGDVPANISGLVEAAPGCFELCPQLCAPLAEAFQQQEADTTSSAIEAMICANAASIRCAYDGAADACRPALSAASVAGVRMPTSWLGLAVFCSGGATTTPPRRQDGGARGGGGGAHHDAPRAPITSATVGAGPRALAGVVTLLAGLAI